MTNQEILEKAIQKAVDGGWMVGELDGITPEKIAEHALYDQRGRDLIFQHDFAKALWGEGQMATTNHRHDLHIGLTGWQFHLQNMVISENPIKYLEDKL